LNCGLGNFIVHLLAHVEKSSYRSKKIPRLFRRSQIMAKNQPGSNQNVCLPGVYNGNSDGESDGDDDDGGNTSPSRRLHGAPTDTEEDYSTTKPVEFSQDPTCLLFCD
jgi:hypothetical protein